MKAVNLPGNLFSILRRGYLIKSWVIRFVKMLAFESVQVVIYNRENRLNLELQNKFNNSDYDGNSNRADATRY